MKIGIRINALTAEGQGQQSLPYMEAHGKRLDQSSQRRRVRDAAPLVWGTLDLQAAYAAHVAGCRMNKGLKKPILHAIAQFPRELAQTEEDRRKLLYHAVDFINASHGGAAVFAARVDQDEEGLAGVDVFFSPKYEKKTKKKSEMWISTTRHGKLLAEKHEAVIRRRNKGKFSTKPRAIGIALQEEFYAYGREVMGLDLTPRTEKDAGPSDRVETEAFKLRSAAEAEQAKVEQQAVELRRQAAMERQHLRNAQATQNEQQALVQTTLAEAQATLLRAKEIEQRATEDRAAHEACIASQDEAMQARAKEQADRLQAAEQKTKADLEAIEAAHQLRLAAEREEAERQIAEREQTHRAGLAAFVEEAARQGALVAAQMMVAALLGRAMPDDPLARHIAPIVEPIARKFRKWWERFRGRIDSMPDPEIPAEWGGSDPK